MNIYPAYILKQNPNYEKQIILLNISKGVGYYYLAVKKLQYEEDLRQNMLLIFVVWIVSICLEKNKQT